MDNDKIKMILGYDFDAVKATSEGLINGGKAIGEKMCENGSCTVQDATLAVCENLVNSWEEIVYELSKN